MSEYTANRWKTEITGGKLLRFRVIETCYASLRGGVIGYGCIKLKFFVRQGLGNINF